MEGQKRIQKYQFSLKQLLGQGSYASVYRGRVIATQQPVAVKVIDKRAFTSAFNYKNLHSEIDIMKKVNHKNIVQLYDIFQTNNNMYIITELCDYDLHNYLKAKRKLSQKQATTYLKQIMEGVKYLNSQNIIHRDLKPANILIKGNQCKIGDFGFAKSVQHQNSILRSIVGTPLYMSPQLLLKQKYTNKSDLWSVGLIYYEMIHGKTPWMANSQIQLLKAIQQGKVSYSKLISEQAKDFIGRCLAVNEDHRISWEQAFQHNLLTEKIVISSNSSQRIPKNRSQRQLTVITENKSALVTKDFMQSDNNNHDSENNSNALNFNGNTPQEESFKKEKSCHTPKVTKNISEIKLKKVEALTPKSNFTNINNKLKQVWALNQPQNNKSPQFKRPQQTKTTEQARKKRHLTMQHEPTEEKE